MDEGRRVHRARSERAGPDQRRRRRKLADVGARCDAAVPVRPADLRHGQGRRVPVRSRTASARGVNRATILNITELSDMSDHFSGPAVMGDPSVDITDFYAFPSPERPGHLVLIMDVFPMATSQSLFSDVVTHRFRLRPLTRSGGSVAHGNAGYAIDVTFTDVTPGSSVQEGTVVTSDGRKARFTVGKPLQQ